MRIRISDLTSKGLHLRDTLPLDPLNERMKEGKNQEIYFTKPPVVEITLFGTSSGATLKGTIEATYLQPCALCLEGKERHVTLTTEVLLKPKAENNEAEDDIGIIFFEGDHVELDPFLQEEIILSLSLYWHPAIDSNKRCIECKKTKEELGLKEEKSAPTFGQLLKQKIGKS